jgi:hypothetical protein
MKQSLLLLTLVAAPVMAAEKFPAQGIAVNYPGDAGIGRDAAVIFAEDFEEPSLEEMWKRWETVTDKPGMSFSGDVPAGSASKRSLVMERTRGSGEHLYRRLKNARGGWGYDRVFARYYVKFDPSARVSAGTILRRPGHGAERELCLGLHLHREAGRTSNQSVVRQHRGRDELHRTDSGEVASVQ